jgi:hypothetical protein
MSVSLLSVILRYGVWFVESELLMVIIRWMMLVIDRWMMLVINRWMMLVINRWMMLVGVVLVVLR